MTNNKYYKLDLEEFFKEEYEKLNYSEGIGASGLVTDKQVINIFNDYKLDEKTGKEWLGLEDHQPMFERLFNDIYSPSDKYYDKYYEQLISIRYWNSPDCKAIVLFLPKHVTNNELENLKSLRKFYKEVFEKYKRIEVGAFTFGNNVREYGPEIQAYSKLEPIIDYVGERLDTSLKREYKEKILKI